MDGEAEGVDRLDAVLGEVAAQTGGEVHRTPAVGREVRRVVLLDHTDERGEQHEVAVLEDDGRVRVLGHDRGERVSH